MQLFFFFFMKHFLKCLEGFFVCALGAWKDSIAFDLKFGSVWFFEKKKRQLGPNWFADKPP